MLFAKYTALLALPLLAVATPGGIAPTTTVTVTAVATTTESASQCDTGALQCCDSVESSDSSAAETVLALLGIVLDGTAIPVGLTCDPISVLGAGGDSCSANPVCCENNDFNGVIALGCTPVDLSL